MLGQRCTHNYCLPLADHNLSPVEGADKADLDLARDDITVPETECSSQQPSSSPPESSQPENPEAPPYSPLTTLPSSPNSSAMASAPSSSGTISELLAWLPEESHVSTRACPTFKIVGDNIDKYVKPREMRIDAQASMLHYFNMYAVRDRLDVSDLPDDAALPDLSSVRVEKVLPDSEDHTALRSNFTVLVGRVLKKHMPFFATFGSGARNTCVLQGNVSEIRSGELLYHSVSTFYHCI